MGIENVQTLAENEPQMPDVPETPEGPYEPVNPGEEAEPAPGTVVSPEEEEADVPERENSEMDGEDEANEEE